MLRASRAAKATPCWILLVLLACLVTGCSYDRAEPSLFGRARAITRETTTPPIRPVTPDERGQVPNPDLPVVGEAVWTSADGLDITMRIAVHAVRRVAGGTVLDWSVTPLHGPGLRPNDPVPKMLDLGLSRPGEGYPSIILVRCSAVEDLPATDAQGFCLPMPLHLGHACRAESADRPHHTAPGRISALAERPLPRWTLTWRQCPRSGRCR
jgi:hypothetical protein